MLFSIYDTRKIILYTIKKTSEEGREENFCRYKFFFPQKEARNTHPFIHSTIGSFFSSTPTFRLLILA